MRTFLACGFVTIFLWRAIAFMQANSPTFDEGARLVTGISYWQTGDFRLNPEDPPLLKLLSALPVVLTEDCHFEKVEPFWSKKLHWQMARVFFDRRSPDVVARMFFKARLVHLAFGVGIVLLVGWWAKRCFGAEAGLLAMGFAALDPTLTAMSCILSLDVPMTFFLALLFYLFWEYRQNPSTRQMLTMGVVIGLALGTKLPAVIGVAIFFAVIALDAWRNPFSRKLLREIPRLILIAMLVLVPIYFVIHFPMWGAGLKQQLLRSGGTNQTYFLGEVTSHGRFLYYPLTLLIKLPIGTLFAFVIALFRPHGIMIPALLYLAGIMYTGVDLGIRLVLPSLVLMMVVAGQLMTWNRCGRIAGISLLALTAISTQRQSPHFVPYFNEFIGGPENGHRYLADSNLDWGQDLLELKAWLDREKIDICYLSYFGTVSPEFHGIRHETLPCFGRFWPPTDDLVPDDERQIVAISVNNYLGIYFGDHPFRFLHTRTPIAKLNHSIWIFDLTNDDEGLRALRLLCRRGS